MIEHVYKIDPATDPASFHTWELLDNMRIESDAVSRVLSKMPGDRNYYYYL